MSRSTKVLPIRWLGVALLAAAPACTPSEAAEPAAVTTYGEAVAIGNGTGRVYVVSEGGAPREIGVALTEGALSGLPSAHDPGGVFTHGHTTFESVLPLPEGNGTPFDHVLVNWNPGGHEPPGIYDTPHFDFHFYTMKNQARLAIDPADPEFQRKAERAPHPDLVPQGYVMPAPMAFARMGVHWVDPASPELNGQPFTHTFIYGSWDGELIFAEPMITKAFLESKQPFQAALPAPKRYAVPGYHPSGWSVRWDEAAKEHRIALTGLGRRG